MKKARRTEPEHDLFGSRQPARVDIVAELEREYGPAEDLSNRDHALEVFVNRWCSLFGHRETALKELRHLVAVVVQQERAAK